MLKLHITLNSMTLYRPVEILAALPHGFTLSKNPPKLLYALHCAMKSGEMFFEDLGFTEFVDKENIALIAPSLGNGFFVNSTYEQQADFLRDELLPTMREKLNLPAGPEHTAIFGVSMGAYGAIRLALDMPGCFGAVAAVSGSYDLFLPPDERIRKNRTLWPLYKITNGLMKKLVLNHDGTQQQHTDIKELLLSRANDGTQKLPRFALFCGEQDYLSLNQSESLAEAFKNHGLACDITLSPGGHGLEFWRKVSPLALKWLFTETQS